MIPYKTSISLPCSALVSWTLQGSLLAFTSSQFLLHVRHIEANSEEALVNFKEEGLPLMPLGCVFTKTQELLVILNFALVTYQVKSHGSALNLVKLKTYSFSCLQPIQEIKLIQSKDIYLLRESSVTSLRIAEETKRAQEELIAG